MGRMSPCQGEDLGSIPGREHFALCWYLIIQFSIEFSEIDCFSISIFGIFLTF